MSMDFFTWPWMELFFKEDTDKYRFDHLATRSYSCRMAWRWMNFSVSVCRIRKRLLTSARRNGAPSRRSICRTAITTATTTWSAAASGTSSSISSARRSITSTIPGANFAFQFWKRMNEDYQAAWGDYLKLCQLGGSQSFLELVKAANLISRSRRLCLSVIDDIEHWLNEVDDEKL